MNMRDTKEYEEEEHSINRLTTISKANLEAPQFGLTADTV